MVYGYVRVSTREQNEERQLIAMREFGVDRIFTDKQSGKDFDRPEYQKLMRKIRPGDVLVVKSLDRFGRNYDEILDQWRNITKAKQVAIVVLDMPMLDTRDDKNLTGRLIADIVLQLLAYVAQTEREMIRQRQREGIDAALARGVKFGRERIPVPPEFTRIAAEYGAGRITAREASADLGVSKQTFFRWCDQNDVPREHGRAPDRRPPRFDQVAELYTTGQITQEAASEMLGVCVTTFRTWFCRDGYARPPRSENHWRRKQHGE